MKKSEMKDKEDGVLLDMLFEKREALRASRFGAAGAAAGDLKSTRAHKKEIARIFTELNSRARVIHA